MAWISPRWRRPFLTPKPIRRIITLVSYLPTEPTGALAMSNPAEPSEAVLAGDAEGHRAALDAMFVRVYDELRSLAKRQLRDHGSPPHTLSTTVLIHESYLRLAGMAELRLDNRAQFFALASKAMRHLIIDYARGRCARRRGGELVRVTLRESATPGEDQSLDVVVLNEALERLGEHDPRLVRLVECRFFGGMSPKETAQALGLSQRTVERDWRRAKTYLHELLEAAT
jgi:RNA polymerase sigma factor (TIGR02999 family)